MLGTPISLFGKLCLSTWQCLPSYQLTENPYTLEYSKILCRIAQLGYLQTTSELYGFLDYSKTIKPKYCQLLKSKTLFLIQQFGFQRRYQLVARESLCLAQATNTLEPLVFGIPEALSHCQVFEPLLGFQDHSQRVQPILEYSFV